MSYQYTPNEPRQCLLNARQSLLHEIDAQSAMITQIEIRIVQLKRSLNALTPVGSLPAELLEKIFFNFLCRHERREHTIPFYCLDCAYQQMDKSRKSHPIMAPVAQVCRSWRELVLGSPRLWSTVPVSHFSEEWLEESLRRSGDMPLFLQVNMYTLLERGKGHGLNRLLRLFEKIPQTGELIVYNWEPQHDVWLEESDHFTRPWNTPVHLRRLAIKHEGSTLSENRWPRLLSNMCPALEVLSMAGFGVGGINLVLLPSLNELHLVIHQDAKLTLDAMLPLLEGLPRLTKLTLEHSSDGDGNAEFATIKTVALPHLRYIRLQGICVLLLANLVLPRRVVISLGCRCKLLPGWSSREYTDLDEYTPVAEALASHYSRSPLGLDTEDLLSISSMYVESNTTFKLFSSPLASGEVAASEPQCQIDIGFFKQTSRRSRSQILLMLCEALPVFEVRQLRVERDRNATGFTEDCWPEIMQAMPLLEEIEVATEASMESLIQALTVEATENMQLSGVPLISLRTLVFGFYAHEYWSYPAETDAFLDSLFIMLNMRRQLGYPLQGLTLDFVSDGDNSFWTHLLRGEYNNTHFERIRSAVEDLKLLVFDTSKFYDYSGSDAGDSVSSQSEEQGQNL